MKRTLLSLFICGIFVITMQGQYVTIEGRQFKDENGEDFYPVICNYAADIIHDGLGNFNIAPSAAYGVNWGYDCVPMTTCYFDAFFHDFTEIRNMGFNAIRLMGPNAEKDSVTPIGFSYFINYWANPNYKNQIIKDLSPNYSSDPSMDLLLNSLDDILAVAGLCSLKVILVPSRGRLAQSQDAVNDVADYLKVFGAHFANNPDVLAYDLYNEPTWVDHLSVFDSAYDHTKFQVCQYVRSWYDSLKLGDPNHLVTMGLGTFNYHDVIEWDPGIMKLDFISEHIYPAFRIEENYNIDTAMIRFKDELIWTARNVPIPWIIGETGFAGTDNSFPPFNKPKYTDSVYTHQPYVWGSLADQKAFADTALKLMRDCGASGISWWQFQDTYWGQNPDSTSPAAYKESFFGLLNSGNWDTVTGYETFRKPAVESFQTFDPTASPGPFPEQTLMYYNPYNFDETDSHMITGYVKELNTGNPINNAVILINSKIRATEHDSTIGYAYPHYTFSDTSGTFHCYPAPDSVYATTIDDVKVSFPGCERIERGWTSAYNSQNIPVRNNELFELGSGGVQYDAEITGITIQGSCSSTFEGWNSLTVSNCFIEYSGECVMRARKEINLLNTFEAEYGSELNVLTGETFPECVDFSGFYKVSGIGFQENIASNKVIELNFICEFNSTDFIVFPNPTTGKLKLHLNNNDKATLNVKFTDLIGNTVLESKFTGPMMNIDLTCFPKGVVLLQILGDNMVLIKKIILQ